MEFGRNLLMRFLNLVVIVLLLALTGVFVVANGVMVTNLINQLQMGAYVDVFFGVQAVLVFVTLSTYFICLKKYLNK